MGYRLLFLLLSLLICSCDSRKPAAASNRHAMESDFTADPAKEMLPPSETEVQCWRNYEIAKNYIAQGNWLKGEEYCFKAIHALKTTDPDHAHGAIRNNTVRPLIMTGKVDDAIEMGLSALQFNLKSKDGIGIAGSYMNIGDAYGKKKDIAKRNEYWLKGYETIKLTGNTEAIRYHKVRVDLIRQEEQAPSGGMPEK